MNIQPHSKKLRRFISVDQYFPMHHQQKNQSLIGLYLKGRSNELISIRLTELEALESQGFVFLGEKNWLQAYLQHEELHSYEQWVLQNFLDYLDIRFEIDPYQGLHFDPSIMDPIWKAVLPLQASKYLLNFKALFNRAYHPIDTIELYVRGNNSAPYTTNMCALFEALHNLEYSMSTFSKDTKGHEPLEITGVEVSNIANPSRVSINVRSEYGAEFDHTIVSGIAWRYQNSK